MYGPLFEHWLGLKPWDLERMTLSQVTGRLAWIKNQVESGRGSNG
jgi:hypothetical protein